MLRDNIINRHINVIQDRYSLCLDSRARGSGGLEDELDLAGVDGVDVGCQSQMR